LISRFNINTAGFVIVGLFLATWLAALLIWRYARIEQKWSPAPSPAHPVAPGAAGPMPWSRMRTKVTDD
jgi:nickel/cobalt transporter (NiCoT) family protein